MFTISVWELKIIPMHNNIVENDCSVFFLVFLPSFKMKTIQGILKPSFRSTIIKKVNTENIHWSIWSQNLNCFIVSQPTVIYNSFDFVTLFEEAITWKK